MMEPEQCSLAACFDPWVQAFPTRHYLVLWKSFFFFLCLKEGNRKSLMARASRGISTWIGRSNGSDPVVRRWGRGAVRKGGDLCDDLRSGSFKQAESTHQQTTQEMKAGGEHLHFKFISFDFL